jgi:putative ABC transport system permease protein
MERAERFLHLTGLVSVVLAAVAIGLSARRFLQRHLDTCAIMRCFGASQARLLRLYAMQFVLLGLLASIAGCAIGAAAQALLTHWLASLVAVDVPPPTLLPLVYGITTGLGLLLGFALPPLAALARVPTLRVIRRDLGAPRASALATYGAGYAVIAAMIFWRAQEWRLGFIVLGGFTAAMLIAGGATWLLLQATRSLRSRGVSWRYGIANLRRRPLASIVQVIALALGIMAILVLTLIRQELLANWQKTLPPEAPNRFMMNIQPNQVAGIERFFEAAGFAPPGLHPMVRGRLVRINERPVQSADYPEERARRLVDREFNLSWASRLREDNQIVGGRWWEGAAPASQFSVEAGIAETLGIKIGDTLTFDIAGTPVSARISNLRKVDWDTFNVNFFVLAPPGVFDGQPASYITSFHLAPGNTALLGRLVREFPNIVLIDVAHLMAQVQRMMDQVARAVQFIFLFTVFAGLIVLYAAIASSQDERLHQAAVMRTLGASRGQLARATLAEFSVLGALAGLLAAAGATGVGYFVATRVLHLSYSFSPGVWIVGTLAGAIAIAAAGYARTRGVLSVSPLKALRDIA